MSEQTPVTGQPSKEAPATAAQKPAQRAISDPREVTALVMARMNQVNAKKDELAVAIHALVDITAQLTRTYSAQLLAVEQLRRRVKALEQSGAGAPDPVPARLS